MTNIRDRLLLISHNMSLLKQLWTASQYIQSFLVRFYWYPIRNLSKGQRWLCVEIVDYSWFGWNCQWSEKIESWLSSIIQEFFLYWKMQLQTGIPTVFDDSELLADYHWHFHVYPMILSFMQLTIVWILKTNTHTHTHTCTLETIYSKIFQLNEIF